MAGDSDEEDFVSFGTPLEPLDEDEPLKKPLPLHEQTVRDERGRFQRFHGAFTGGFSAGYFNTVGTKEGWAPSTFVSSRQQKAEKQNVRPEDFMDEEDFGEHGIAPREISTSLEFTSSRRDTARDKARAINSQSNIIPGDTLLEDIISPARSSIGVELLRRMGWREGQGVGPRVKRKPRRQDPGGLRVYGCAPPPAGSEESEEDDGEFAPEDVTFAPKDVTPVDFSPRLGVQGLGYRGLDPTRALLGPGGPEHIDLFKPQSESRTRLFGGPQKSSRRGGLVGQAFGIGALEDDDDEEVYHRDSMSRYDTVLGGEEPGDGLYGWTAPQQHKKTRDKDSAYLGKILEGFTLAQRPPEDKVVFPPPVLPRDYRPVRRLRPDVSVLTGVSPALAEALRTSRGHMVPQEPQPAGRHQLDSDQRRSLLGEEVLQGPRSVLELLKPEDRQRLLNIRNSSSGPPSKAPVTPDSHDALQAASGSGLQQQQEQQEALTAWRGVQTSSETFRPFEKNPSKQARYERYLDRLRQGDRGGLEQSLDPGMTEWERGRERDEFVRASILYRPSASSLSSRFTRAKTQDQDLDQVQAQDQDQEGDEDDQPEAVTVRQFGKMTRETFTWYPDKLLVKRFNVPDPHPGSSLVGVPKVKRDKFSVFNFLSVTERRDTSDSMKKSRWDVSDQEKKKKEQKEVKEEVKEDPLSELIVAARNQTDSSSSSSSSSAPPAPPASSSTVQIKAEEQQEEQQEEEEEEEEESRPSMDLFKAIFASSSSSSEGESEEEEEEEEEKEDHAEPLNLFSITSSGTTSSSTNTSSTNTSSGTTSSTTITSSSSQQKADEEFGPKLPPPSANQRGGGGGGATSSSSSTREEEKHPRRSKDKKHKHKKEKKKKEDKEEKKKKKKHKEKKKKKKKTKEEEQEEEQEGGARVSTEELLRRLKNVRSLETW